MLHLRNINPMVRAVGTMGIVSALVGGITFAQLTSNTVALSPNTLSTGSANLQIAAVSNNNRGDNTDNNAPTTNAPDNFSGNNNNNTSCNNATNGSIPGFNLTGSNGLLPGVTSNPLGFCLKNASNVPLDLTAAIPDNPFSGVGTTGIQPSDVTLRITCNNGGNASGTLNQYVSTNTTAMTLGSLAANRSTNCQATVRLSNTATITGTQTLPSFDIDFTGTTSS